MDARITVALIGVIGVIGTILVAILPHILPPNDGGNSGGSQTPATPVDTLSGRYSMDEDLGKIMIISHSSGNMYNIGQPSGAWPWEGTATLDGGHLLGNCMSTTSPATFVFDGVVLGDRSIDAGLRFITDANGNPAGGRVDRHRFMPIS